MNNFKGWQLLCSLLLVSALAMAEQHSQQFNLKDDTLTFMGVLSDDVVDEMIKFVPQERELKRLVINSPGGPVSAGITLGNWVFDRKLDVEVDSQCLSSCANYVFTAGKRKIIRKYSLVAWHGGAKQKDFREDAARIERIIWDKNAGKDTHEDDEEFFKKKSIWYENQKKILAREEAFFRKIGVLEYLVRAGQEPLTCRGFWFTDPDVLKDFGVCNIESDEFNQTWDYLVYWRRIMDLSKTPVCKLEYFGSVKKQLAIESANSLITTNKCQ